MRRVLVVLNERAGTLIDHGVRKAAELIESTLAARAETVHVRTARGRGIARAIDRAVGEDYDTIVVGGGDGSGSCAAARLAGSEKTLGVLPFGTLNLLARDLGFPIGVEAAIEALGRSEPRVIDVATLNKRPFHTLSGVGFFSQMARAREETRDLPGKALRVAAAALRAFWRSGRMTLDIVADGRRERLDVSAVLITNNRFDPDWRRPSLADGLLEVHVAEDGGALEKLKLGAELMAGAWRTSGAIRSIVAREVRIESVRRRAWVSTDGELLRERAPLEYGIMPRALRVLAVPS